MNLMQQIHSGKRPAPRRALLYGVQGVGKSLFASRSPKPVFLQTEDGLGEIDCEKFPLTTSYEQAIAALSELYSEKHPYQTIVVDSLDWLERLIWAEVCRKRNVESIEDIGYGKGYILALTQWREFLTGLEALRNERGMMTILVAHSRIERFENPETETYDRYVPRLHKLAAAVVQEWCDEVLFATYRVHTKKTDEGFNRKRTQAIGSGERILRTTERPSHLAKNRLNLPEELPLEWAAYAEFLGGKDRKAQPAPKAHAPTVPNGKDGK